MKEEETKKILSLVEEIENTKDDSRRMFQVVKHLQKRNDKNKVIVDGKDGKTTNEKQQVEIVSKFFEEMFNKNTEKDIENIEPHKMKVPFNTEEIRKAAKSLKNGKSPGIDNLNAELIKYGPEEVYKRIAEIFNEVAESGVCPNEIKEGVLIPIPKPGKKVGPPGHLRPIILLSILRKILAICMLRRCLKKFLEKVPSTQAAYQQGRSTTELVFSFKVLAEKAIMSEDYKIILLLLDMSKAFDTVRRNELFKILKEILDKDELHMMKILVEDVKLRIRIGKSVSEEVKTNIGVPQGDCLSPILFIIYLAEALKPTRSIAVPSHIEDHMYSKLNSLLMIDQQYADDVSWITNNTVIKENLKKEVPTILKDKNLKVNEGKTEEYQIGKGESDDWKKCKYLGSLLDTEKDIKRRKILAIDAYRKLRNIFESKKISLEVKLRLMRSHIQSIFLYNCELWTLTKNLEYEIDVFQRSILRRILDIKWYDKISNKDLYSRTKEVEWSKTVKRRRLQWFGHLLRLPEITPAKRAYREAQRYSKKSKGGRKLNWIKLVERDLKDTKVRIIAGKVITKNSMSGVSGVNDVNRMNGRVNDLIIEVSDLELLAKNRHIWSIVVNCAMSS